MFTGVLFRTIVTIFFCFFMVFLNPLAMQGGILFSWLHNHSENLLVISHTLIFSAVFMEAWALYKPIEVQDHEASDRILVASILLGSVLIGLSGLAVGHAGEILHAKYA